MELIAPSCCKGQQISCKKGSIEKRGPDICWTRHKKTYTSYFQKLWLYEGQSHILPDLCSIFYPTIPNWWAMEHRQATDEMNDFSNAVQLLWWSSEIPRFLSSNKPPFSHGQSTEAAVCTG